MHLIKKILWRSLPRNTEELACFSILINNSTKGLRIIRIPMSHVRSNATLHRYVEITKRALFVSKVSQFYALYPRGTARSFQRNEHLLTKETYFAIRNYYLSDSGIVNPNALVYRPRVISKSIYIYICASVCLPIYIYTHVIPMGARAPVWKWSKNCTLSIELRYVKNDKLDAYPRNRRYRSELVTTRGISKSGPFIALSQQRWPEFESLHDRAWQHFVLIIYSSIRDIPLCDISRNFNATTL